MNRHDPLPDFASRSRGARHGRRAGVTLAEVALTLVLLGIAAALVVEAGAALLRQQRGLERRLVAQQLAAGALEQVRGWTWDELTTERLEKTRRDAAELAALPDGDLQLAVADLPTEESPDGGVWRRIDVVVSWRAADGADRRTTRMSAWRRRP